MIKLIKEGFFVNKYVPDIYQKSIYTIDYSTLYSKGIRCLLFDLDNTIIASKEKKLPEKAKDLFVSLKQKGFKVIILSNSPKTRVRQFGQYFDVPCYHLAFKPLKYKFKKVLSDNHFLSKEAAIIGDQIMTDVLGGNKMGMTTILVNPVSESDVVFTKFNRFLERRKLKQLESQNLFSKGKYYE